MKPSPPPQCAPSDEEKLPLVSIGIPTYNRPHGLLRAVSSIDKQNYGNVEILISDNGSTDNTSDLCRELEKQRSNITFVRQPINRGITYNFNHVLQMAKGDYFLWLADDDYLDDNILTKYVDFLRKNPDFVLVTGNINYWENGKLRYTETDFTVTAEDLEERILSFYSKILFAGIYHGLMKREAIASIEIKNLMASDWYFLAAVISLGKFKNLDFPGYNKSFGGASQTFEGYAERIGSGKFSAYNPLLYMAWNAGMEIAVREPVFQAYRHPKRLWLGAKVFFLIFNRFYTQRMISSPFHFFRSLGGSMAKTILPSKITLFIKYHLNKEPKSRCFP